PRLAGGAIVGVVVRDVRGSERRRRIPRVPLSERGTPPVVRDPLDVVPASVGARRRLGVSSRQTLVGHELLNPRPCRLGTEQHGHSEHGGTTQLSNHVFRSILSVKSAYNGPSAPQDAGIPR